MLWHAYDMIALAPEPFRWTWTHLCTDTLDISWCVGAILMEALNDMVQCSFCMTCKICFEAQAWLPKAILACCIWQWSEKHCLLSCVDGFHTATGQQEEEDHWRHWQHWRWDQECWLRLCKPTTGDDDYMQQLRQQCCLQSVGLPHSLTCGTFLLLMTASEKVFHHHWGVPGCSKSLCDKILYYQILNALCLFSDCSWAVGQA